MEMTSIIKAPKNDYTILNVPYVRYEKATNPWKHHRTFEEHTLIFITNGSCYATCDNNKYLLSKGDLLYVKKGKTYSSTEHEFPFEYIMLEFEIDETTPLSNELKEYYEIANPDKYNLLFNEIYRIFNTAGPASSLKLKRNLYDIFIYLSEETTYYKDNYNYRKIRHAVKYMNENIFEKYVDVKTLADISELSLSQFNRIFKSVFQKTPTKYMNDLRISRGKKLLSETSLSVGIIADMCGFSSTYYFSKMIKSATGISPLQYRTKYFK